MLKWLPEETKVLQEMVTAGKDEREISKVLKSRTPKAIQDRCDHLGLTLHRNAPEIDMDAFKRLMGRR